MEFMPVVLAAGVGRRVNHLTSHYPKALLPVGNMPTIFYPLAMLEKHGFAEAIVVTPRSFEDEIRTTLLDRCNIKMKLVFESINDTQLEEHGTAQTLCLVRHRIPEHANVLVVSGDLITDLNLNHLMSMFYKTDASVTMLLTTMGENRDLPVPGLDRAKQKSLEKEKKANRNIIGINESCGRVIVMEPLNDPEDELELDPRIFQKYPKLRLRTTMSDCHLYLMRRWILDYLAIHKDCESMSSLKSEVLPYLVKKQFPSDSRLKKSRQWITPSPVEEPYVRLMPVSKDHDIYAHAEIPASVHRHKATLDLAEAMSPNMDCGTSESMDIFRSEETFHGTQNNDVIRCYAYIQESGFCMRTNTLSGYCEANNQIAKIFPQVAPQNKAYLIHPSVKVSRSTQVGPDCFIGENCKVGDKVVMKKSAVGANCTLKDKAKLSNSIIMDQATIGENCMVMNSVVCSGAVLAEKCEIKDCIIFPSTTIQPLGKHTNELLSDGDRSMD